MTAKQQRRREGNELFGIAEQFPQRACMAEPPPWMTPEALAEGRRVDAVTARKIRKWMAERRRAAKRKLRREQLKNA